MSILIDENTNVLVQGITGREGGFHAGQMLEYFSLPFGLTDNLNIEAFYQKLFDRMIPNDFPFLGCCSGNGLLGQFCGSPISRTYAEPIGSVEVTVTEAGTQDPLLKGLPGKFDAMVGHKEACDQVPEGAVLLASSKTCPVQMFRIGSNIYATQFHPEADSDEFILRINTYKDHGYFAPEEADALIAAVSQADTPVAREILRRFVARYKEGHRNF